jgi:hypothetical protein
MPPIGRRRIRPDAVDAAPRVERDAETAVF